MGLALAATTAACGGSAQANGDLIAAMKQKGCAKVALAEAPPYSTITAGGQAGGYVPAVTEAVLGKLGVPRLCAESATYDAMIPGLQAGTFDALPGALNITAERCAVIAFSQPVTAQHEALAVTKGDTHGITDYAAIAKNPEVKLAVFSGSAQEAFARRRGVQQSQLVTVPDSQTGIAAVKSGRAHAFGAGQFTLRKVADASMDVRVDASSPVSMIGIGFRKKDVAARDAFDAELERMRASGALATLYTSHGFPNPEEIKSISRALVSKACV
ncbi:ectoine/hydroxyectoine ABC transporter substrate-binding protein EhuB [Nonomuraea rhizosphaerae]|uniref:ectoine/hydroxyectoine ABC transporter substrate-binding protein EhuB n=1 Tax=Nonomuraea rhizosphaerae TaxID=2665663 RepID=UPI001C5D3A5F|nr:ectoine/hydroxyectoine ABC transporter substrate-binding protein EhuB [Nonomuraea rhizosphaerae]